MSDGLPSIEDLVAEVQRIEGAEISHLIINPGMWAAIQFSRPPCSWKPRSIRAARWDRGRMTAAMRKAEVGARP
jgi:hypothetical protein